MNKQQLQTARLQRWSQNNTARLTQEDAQAWLETVGFCPLAPLTLPGNPPTPTLLEAFQGKPLAQPTLAERTSMHSLLARLIQAKTAVPLLLISPPGEQPDFVATLEALPFLYAMRGDRDWKAEPAQTGQGRVSHLALHCWQEIEKNGPQTLSVLQRALGNEITEAAALRALCELWGHLRVVPLLQVDDAGEFVSPVWELLSRRYPKQVSIGAALGQPAALSGILSLYLSAVLAASDEEIVAFLSPLASQSKAREMVHGLTATRQLGRIPYEGGMLLHLKDGLPAELLIDLSEPTIFANEDDSAARPGRGFGRDAGRDSARGPIRKWEPRSRPDSRPERSARPAYAARPERSARPEGFAGAEGSVRPERAEHAERSGFSERPERPAYSGRPARPAAGGFGPKKFGAAKKFDSPKNFSAKKPFTSGKSFSPAKPFSSSKPFPSKDAQERGTHDAPQRSYSEAKRKDYPDKRRESYPDAKRKSYSDAPPKRSQDGPRSDRPAAFDKRAASGEQAASGERPAFRPTRPGSRPGFVSNSSPSKPFPKRFGAKPEFRRLETSTYREPKNRESGSREFGSSEPRSRELGNGERRGGAAKPWSKPRSDSRSESPSRPRTGARPAADSGGAKPAWKKPRASEPGTSPVKFKKFDTSKPYAKKSPRDKANSKKAAPGKSAPGKTGIAKEGASSAAPGKKEPFWMKPMHPKRKKKND